MLQIARQLTMSLESLIAMNVTNSSLLRVRLVVLQWIAWLFHWALYSIVMEVLLRGRCVLFWCQLDWSFSCLPSNSTGSSFPELCSSVPVHLPSWSPTTRWTSSFPKQPPLSSSLDSASSKHQTLYFVSGQLCLIVESSSSWLFSSISHLQLFIGWGLFCLCPLGG